MAPSKHLLDPEISELILATGTPPMTDSTLAEVRNMLLPPPSDAAKFGIKREEIFIPSPGSPDVRCLLYTPGKALAELTSGYLHVHGGGYIAGSPEIADELNCMICSELDTVVLSVDYRLAPEHPIPAPLDDCYAALGWLHDNAKRLNVDPKRIGTGGESAGGGLAAALAIKARDAGQYPLCWQQLTYPMLDDRTGTDEAPGDPLVGQFIWDRTNNKYGWDAYLGDAERAAPQVPSRVESFEGLPPAWILTASLDLFRDENISYAQNLMTAGVAAELVVYPGACHAFQMALEAGVTKRYSRDFIEALARGLAARNS